MNWLLTVVFSVLAYTLFSYFGLRTAGSVSAARAALAPVSNALNFGLIMVGTVGFRLALFFGAKATAFAVTVVIALGVVVSFAFAAVIGGAVLKMSHMGGIALILLGVALLK